MAGDEFDPLSRLGLDANLEASSFGRSGPFVSQKKATGLMPLPMQVEMETPDINETKAETKTKNQSSETQTKEPIKSSRSVLIQTLKVHGGLLLVNVLFAAFSVAGKFAMVEIKPLMLLTIRYSICAPFMFLACTVMVGPIRLSWKEIGRAFLLGFFGVYVPQILYFTGLQFTTATNATILQLVIPPVCATVAVIFKREKGSWGKALGIGSAVVGAAFIVGLDGFSIDPKSLIGDTLLIIMTLFSAFFYLYQQILMDTHHPFVVAVMGFSTSAIFSVVGTIWDIDGWRSLTHISLPSWLGLLYITMIGTVFCYMLLPWCQNNSSILTASSYITVQPLIAALLASFLLGESLSWTLLVGGFFIVIGLVLVAFARYREQRVDALKQLHSKDSVPVEEFTSITHVLTEEEKQVIDHLPRLDDEEAFL